MLQCANHPESHAHFECNECGGLACPQCVGQIHAGGVDVTTCQACGAVCHPVITSEEDSHGFFERLPSAFVFPFKSNGWMLVLGGVLLFWAIDWLASITPLGFVIAAVGAGLYGAFLMHVVSQSALGEMDAGPEWPEFRDFSSDIIGPFFRILIFLFLLALPIAGGLYLQSTVLTVIAALLVAVYAPMAFVAVSIFKRATACLYFLPVGRAIVIAPGQYTVAWLLFTVLLGVGFGLSALSSADLGFLPSLSARFLGIYVAIVEMRVLGLLYRANSDEIGWI